MKKQSINVLREVAKASDYGHWTDYIYDYVLNGNNLRNVCDKLSKKATLEVIDGIVSMMTYHDELFPNKDVLRKMYTQAYTSLGDRL